MNIPDACLKQEHMQVSSRGYECVRGCVGATCLCVRVTAADSPVITAGVLASRATSSSSCCQRTSGGQRLTNVAATCH